MNRFSLPVGLVAPETAEEVQEASTVQGMRRAIQNARRDSAVIAAALDTAYHQGLNGEDTYTLLAYHALVALESYAQRLSELLKEGTGYRL